VYHECHNEVAVEEFLNNRIGFLQMSDVIGETMEKIAFIECPSIGDYQETDFAARGEARRRIGEGRRL
jgi:1-deoxy-D-xylulose-5-phosphate reductoisomerase